MNAAGLTAQTTDVNFVVGAGISRDAAKTVAVDRGRTVIERKEAAGVRVARIRLRCDRNIGPGIQDGAPDCISGNSRSPCNAVLRERAQFSCCTAAVDQESVLCVSDECTGIVLSLTGHVNIHTAQADVLQPGDTHISCDFFVGIMIACNKAE